MNQKSKNNDQINLSEEYRQAELMYLKSYAVWLSMREKEMSTLRKRPA
ncbi:MAG: hypothetical protein GX075_13385 [Firmicutes bacterium]|nr:hypothetical protein [Bacillota bacterium]